MKIKKAVKQLKRKLKGPVTFQNVAAYLRAKGYTVILFDSETEELRRYNLVNIAKERLSFTYKDEVSFVFVKQDCIEVQKLNLLLHEAGHIELNHFDDLVTTDDEKEYQAELFAHLAVEGARTNALLAVTLALLCVSVCINITAFKLFSETVSYSDAEPESVSRSDAVMVSSSLISDDISTQSTKTYYVTKTGKRYHTADCRYAANAYPVNAETAMSYYSPCMHCNPR